MQGRTIAVVEDARVIADAVAARLRKEGFEVETAADGPSGIDLCRTLRPDAVVLDLMLPGVDGLEVCKEIQRDRKRAGADAHRAGLRGRPARRPRRGRRRLHDQAVQHAGAGRPAAGGAAPTEGLPD